MPAREPKDNAVAELLKGTTPALDSGQLLRDIIARWGGIERFARDLVGEFTAAKKGSFTRQKMLEMIQKLVVTNTVHQVTKIERPEDLETEDIDRKILEYTRRAVNHVEATDEAPKRYIEPLEENEPAPDI
jgi:hypothetical protein